MGHPVLRRRAAAVTADHAALLPDLVRDMVETMYDARGIGLAAPQVAESLRVIVFLDMACRETDEPATLQVLINPEVVPVGADIALDWEGCLSIPGLRGEVARHARIRYSGIDGTGQRVEREATGLAARVVQHEVDHLDGILYPDRMTDMRRFGFVEELDDSEDMDP